MKFIKSKGITLRKTGEFYFLIDPKLSYNSDEEDIFQTDEIGACIWNSINDNVDLKTITQKVLSYINDEKTEDLIKTVTNDIEEYLQILSYNGLVEVKE